MGTTVRILLYARNAPEAERFSAEAFARIRELNDRFSDYSDTSELAGVSRAAGGPAVRVSHDLVKVLRAAQRISARTDGAFDVTIGPVSHLWRHARAAGEPPDPARLAVAHRLVGYRRLHVSSASRTVRLERRGMILDLGGIAKGFAADAALEILVRRGATRSLVAVGGDIVAGEPPPGKTSWDVTVAPLGPAAESPQPTIALSRGAISSSGDTEQFLDVADRHYSHIVNPATGSAETGRRGVTVMAPNGLTADALATALKVLGAARGLPIVDRIDGAAALVIELTAAGRQEHRSRRWAH